jgi:hypothetical protein
MSMKTNKPTNYKELLEEKERLETALAICRDQIRKDVVTLNEEVRPIKDVLTGIGKFTVKGKTNPLIGIGLDLAADVLLQKVLLGRTSWIMKLAVPFLLQKYRVYALNKNGKDAKQLAGHLGKNGLNGHASLGKD